ncbi:MAG TPA: energy transducer TonB [Opitutaceae bacterium]|nr:energy transducer TonB [Opitutaceae bacterium]
MKTRYIGMVCGGLLAAGIAFGQMPQLVPEWQSVQIKQTVEPVFPPHLLQIGVTQGMVRVAINTDAEGKLVEMLVVGYTRPEFADSAVAAIKQWQFGPARLRGEAVGTTVEMFFQFEARGVVVSTCNFNDVVEKRVADIMGIHYVYQPCSLAELDRIPTPIVAIKPQYPVELAEKGVKGSVTVEFYIDETGAIRVPAVSVKDDSQLSALAVIALRQWKFEPPTRNGRPVLVRASQLFNFGPGS